MSTVAPPAASEPSLTRRAVRGAVWSVPASVVSRGIGLVGTLLLARYLAPAEYGVVAAASIIIMTANALTTFGVGIYLVSARNLTPVETFHATCWFLTTGVVALAAALFLSGPLGAWAGAPDVSQFMPMFAVIMVLERIAYIPERLLVRQLRFARLSITRACGELLYSFVTVGLAAYGAGAISIVWGALARALVRFVAFVPAVNPRAWLQPHRPRFGMFREILRYALSVSGASVATFALRRWDNLLIGRYFGADVMGAYNYAYNLADTPAAAVGEQLGDVIGASFPHVGPAQRAEALVRSITMVAVVMFPLAFGMGVVAPTLAAALFPARWQNVGLMLIFLSVISAARPIGDILQSYFYAGGRPATVVVGEWLSLLLMLAVIPFAGRFGLEVTCCAVSAVFVFRTLAAIGLLRYQEGASVSRMIRPMVIPLLLSLSMVLAVVAVRPGIASASPLARLLIEIGTGGVLYIGGAMLIARPTVVALLSLVRSALAPR